MQPDKLAAKRFEIRFSNHIFYVQAIAPVMVSPSWMTFRKIAKSRKKLFINFFVLKGSQVKGIREAG